MAEEKYPINIWINEDRYAKLEKAGLADMCQEMLAGLKVFRVYANDAEKDKIFDKCVEKQSMEILGEFLSAY